MNKILMELQKDQKLNKTMSARRTDDTSSPCLLKTQSPYRRKMEIECHALYNNTFHSLRAIFNDLSFTQELSLLLLTLSFQLKIIIKKKKNHPQKIFLLVSILHNST